MPDSAMAPARLLASSRRRRCKTDRFISEIAAVVSHIAFVPVDQIAITVGKNCRLEAAFGSDD